MQHTDDAPDHPLSVLKTVGDPETVLKTVKKLWRQPQICDPIEEILKQITNMLENVDSSEDIFSHLDFNHSADEVRRLISLTAKSCNYIVYIIGPLWAHKPRGLDVEQINIDIDRLQQSSVFYNNNNL